MPRREEICAHCGESFRAGRPSCPHCGSDRDTGWNPDEDAGIELPETSLDDEAYDEFLKSEGLSPQGQNAANRRSLIIILLVIALLGPILAYILSL